MITKLEQHQIDLFPTYVKKWVDIGLNTEPTDMIEAVKAIKGAYAKAGIPEPEYFIGPVNSPHEGAVAEAFLHYHVKNKTNFKSGADLNRRVLEEVEQFNKGTLPFKYHLRLRLPDAHAADGLPVEFHRPQLGRAPISISNQIYGSQEYWLSYYDYFMKECGLDLNLVEPLIALSKVCGWWTPLSNVAIIQHRAEEIHRDNENRLHNENGPAVKFRGENNASNVYAVHGVRVSKKVIDRDYGVAEIESENNAEVRRVMIDLYGQSKYIVDSGAQVVHTDDFGTLYRKEIPGDEPLMMVKVVNSTQEPDGTFKDYWIRVDPNAYGGLKTARAAVASTWRDQDAERSFVFKNPEDYNPDIET